VAEIPKERIILNITLTKVPTVILDVAKIHTPPRSDRPAHAEKITKNT
jgi:hypothetical protein